MHTVMRRIDRNAKVIAVASIVYAVGGVLIGIALAFETSASSCYGGICDPQRHPYAGIGLFLAFSALFSAAFSILICDYVRVRTAATVIAPQPLQPPPPHLPTSMGWPMPRT